MTVARPVAVAVGQAVGRSVDGGSVADPLVFHALDDVDGSFVNDVITGVGSLTEARTSTIYLPDDSSPTVWPEFGSTVPGEYYADSDGWLYGAPAATNSQLYSNNLAKYDPGMMTFDGSSEYYSLATPALTGNQITLVARFNAASQTGAAQELVRVYGNSGKTEIRIACYVQPSDHATADRQNRLEVLIGSSGGTLCRLVSDRAMNDGSDHIMFFAFDASNANFTFRIDGANADDTGNPARVAPTTGSMYDVTTGSMYVGAYYTTSINHQFDGQIGYFGIRDAYLTNYSDFMSGSDPLELDETTWTEWGAQPEFWNQYATMTDNKGSAGNMTKNGTITGPSYTPWVASNMIVAQDVTGMRDDATAACTLTATAGNATVMGGQLTAVSDDQTTRWFISRKTGAGTIEITVDGGTTWQDVTTEVDSSANFNECIESLAATANPQIGIRIVTSGDAVYVGNAEAHTAKAEVEIRRSGPIFTAGAAVTVNTTNLSFDDANHSDTQGAYYLEFLPYFSTAESLGIDEFLSLAGSADLAHYDSSGSNARSSDGTNLATESLTLVAGASHKIGIAYGTGGLRINVDGSWGTAVSYDGAFQSGSAMEVLRVITRTCLIRNIRRYDLNYAAAQTQIDELMARP